MDTQTPTPVHNPNASDGSELTPAEVAARAEREGETFAQTTTEAQPGHQSLRTDDGYKADKEGRLNNYAVRPPMYVQQQPRFGFTRFAELWNGRVAMLGFVALVAIELLAGESIASLWFGVG